MFQSELESFFSPEELELFLELYKKSAKWNKLINNQGNFETFWYVDNIQEFIGMLQEERKIQVLNLAIERHPQILGYTSEQFQGVK